MSDIVPNNEAYLLPGGSTGCILLHGFSSMPEEMRPLGDNLAAHGFTVLGARLAGHATQPEDLTRIRWTDWMADVEDGLALLSSRCTHRVLIGQSLGGMIALAAAARLQVSAVITLSTPYGIPPGERLFDLLQRLFQPMVDKRAARFPPGHPLYHRRELNYPAYPEYPSRVLKEADRLGTAMVAALPHVTAPVLLIQSRADRSVPFKCMQQIYDHLGSAHKEMLAVDGMDHSLVLDPRREVVFEAILAFIKMAFS